MLSKAPGDARLVQVVGRHFHLYAVADSEAHPTLAHFAAYGGKHEVLVVQFDPEHSAGQHRGDTTLDLNVFFFHG